MYMCELTLDIFRGQLCACRYYDKSIFCSAVSLTVFADSRSLPR